MDIFDRAQELEELERSRSIERALARSQVGPALEECEEPDCGAPIPLQRRLAVPGVTRCVECAERQERRQRVFTRP